MKPFIRQANQVGLFLVLLYIVCMLWYWINPSAQDLHINLMQLMFLGFEDMTAGSMLLGLIQSYIWGYIFLALWIASMRIADLIHKGKRR